MNDQKPPLVKALDKVAQQMAVDAAELINHKPSKGREREAQLLEDYLERYLPRNVSLVNGAEIVDSTGNVSPECDVVIVDPRTPPLMDGKGFQILPVECVYGVIEVKSKLDKKELQDALDKIRLIKQMPKTAFRPQVGDVTMNAERYGKQFGYFPTMGHVFAYSAISLDTLAQHLRELQRDVPVEERIDGIFVLDAGAVLYTSDSGQPAAVCETDAMPIMAVSSQNPLIPMTLVLQGYYMGAFSPGFRIVDYLQNAEWGTPTSQA